MKKSKTKILILLLFVLLFSCCRKSELEDVFIGNKKDYWNYKDDCQSYGIYFKFNKKGDYDKYLSKPIKEGKGFDLFNNDGDAIGGPRSWSIKNDSTFVWNNEDYKIESCTNQKIVLAYYHYKEKSRRCIITLKKVVDE